MGLRRVPVTTTVGFERLIAKGHKERSTGVTSANAHSSRSHAVIRFDVVVKGKQSKPGESVTFVSASRRFKWCTQREEILKNSVLKKYICFMF